MRQTQNYSLCKRIIDLHPSPSGQLKNRKALSQEVQIIWNKQFEEIKSLLWVRESVIPVYGRKPQHIKRWLGYSLDEQGNLIRYWWVRQSDFEDYAALGTCPSEAIFPLSIEMGRPSLPALPYCTQLES